MTPERAREILGLEQEAGAPAVQRAYRRKALEWHPDRASDPDESDRFTRRFMEVRDAYECLKKGGFPALPEPSEVVPDPPQVRSYERRFKLKPEDMPVGWLEKLGFGPGPSVETLAFWGFLLPAAFVGMFLSFRWLLGVLRGEVGP